MIQQLKKELMVYLISKKVKWYSKEKVYKSKQQEEPKQLTLKLCQIKTLNFLSVSKPAPRQLLSSQLTAR
jgi:hypothetical protein